MRFLNHAAWNLGVPPLFELLVDSGEDMTLFVAPRRKRYATLLADMISVFACLNCNHPKENATKHVHFIIYFIITKLFAYGL